MLTADLGDGAQLRSLQPWQHAEFLEHLDRAREHIRPWVSPSFVATDAASARGVLESYAERTARDDGGIWGIWDDGTLVGGVLFVSFNAVTGTCEAGCWLEPAAQGRGLVTRAMHLLLDWAFHERGMNRVEWRTLPANARSIAVASRLGMSKDGTLREVSRSADGPIDLEVWSLLAREWRPASPGSG